MQDPDVPARPLVPEPVSLLARVQQLRSDPRVAVALVALAVIAGVVVWVRTSNGAAAPPAADAVANGTTVASASDSTSTTVASGLVVHVVGAVQSSGVVELLAGARVRDAVVAAGGAADDADLQRLNLAAPVTDGQRIAVPRIGEPDPAPVAGENPGGTTGGGTEVPAGPLNLNTASATELEILPGIGPTLAEAIIREREKRGGFDAVDDLKEVRGIGEGRFADIRDLVTV
jgi:competence protein ComEA